MINEITITQVENRWVNKANNIDLNAYDLPEDISDVSWIYLHDDLKQAYAEYMNWIEDEYWDEDDDKLFEAEEAGYSVITEIRKQLGYK